MRKALLATSVLFPCVAWAGGPIVTPNVFPAWATVPLGIAQLTTDGTYYNIRQFGASLNGCSASPHDDAAAVLAAVAQVNSDWTNFGQVDTVYIPPGCLYSSTGFVFGQGVPAHVLGAGADISKFVWATSGQTGTNFSGDTIAFSGAFGGSRVLPSFSTITSLSTYATGASVRDLTIIGNTTLTGNGIMYYDFNDHIYVQHNVIDFVPGCAICIGLYKNTTQGVTREGFIEDNRLEVVGSTGTMPVVGVPAPAIGIFSSCNGTSVCNTGSSSNALTIDRNRIYGYATDGISICNQSQNQGEHKIWFDHNQIEGLSTGSAGDGIHLGNAACPGLAYYDLHIDNDTVDVTNAGRSAIHLDGNSTYGTLANAPYAVDIRGMLIERGGISGANGITLDYGGRAIQVETSFVSANGTSFVCNSGVQGTVTLLGGQDASTWTENLACGASHVSSTALETGTFAAGDFTLADGNGRIYDSGKGLSAIPLAPTCNTFTSSGTWTKLSTSTLVSAFAVGGGGGGGGGATLSGAGSGGAGGGGAAYQFMISFPAALVNNTLTVTVGAAGAAGNPGAAGGAGGATLWGNVLQAGGGGGGGGGSSGATSGGGGGGGVTGTNGVSGTTTAGAGGSGGGAGGTGAAGSGGNSGGGGGGGGSSAVGTAFPSAAGSQGASGGGGGGGFSAANTGTSGAVSGLTYAKGATAATIGTGGASCTAGGAGSAPQVWPGVAASSGGGGGGAQNTGTGCAGGAGAFPGGGGGGGGSGSSGAGAGGAGGAGELTVCQW